MAVDVYFKPDIANILRALALGADRYHGDYKIALVQVAAAFGIRNADPMLEAPDRLGETHPGWAMSHPLVYSQE